MSWGGTGYMQSMSWCGTGYMQSMSWGGTGYMQSMSRGGTGYMQSTSTSSEYSSLMTSFLWICNLIHCVFPAELVATSVS